MRFRHIEFDLIFIDGNHAYEDIIALIVAANGSMVICLGIQYQGTQKWMVDSFWTMDDNGQIVFVVHTHTIFHHLLSSNKNSPFFLSKFGHFKGLSRTFNSVTNGNILAKPSANPGLQQDDVKDLRNHNMGKKATSKYGLRNLNQLVDRFPYYGLS